MVTMQAAGRCLSSLSKRFAIMRWISAASASIETVPALWNLICKPFSAMLGS